jgi:hypothetical protein
MSEVGLPENLWIGVVDAINNKAPHDDVATYLGQQAE